MTTPQKEKFKQERREVLKNIRSDTKDVLYIRDYNTQRDRILELDDIQAFLSETIDLLANEIRNAHELGRAEAIEYYESLKGKETNEK